MLLLQKSAILSLHTVIYFTHTTNDRIKAKQTQRKRHQNTAHCRQSVKQTAQRAENVVEHAVPDKNRSGALNAMRSLRRETKDNWETE